MAHVPPHARGWVGVWRTHSFNCRPKPQRDRTMKLFADFLDFNWLPEWMTSWTFMILMFLVLVGLIIVLMVIRNKRPEDD
jgi:hypothetical protein